MDSASLRHRLRLLCVRGGIHFSDNLAIVDIGALEVSNMGAGNIKTDTLEVQSKAQFDQDILVHGGLNVGHNALIGGALAITGSASSTLVASTTVNTNPALTIQSGFVGLGTTTPQATLTIEGQTAQTQNLFAVASSSMTSTTSTTTTQGSAGGYYATIDSLGKTTTHRQSPQPHHGRQLGPQRHQCDAEMQTPSLYPAPMRT